MPVIQHNLYIGIPYFDDNYSFNILSTISMIKLQTHFRVLENGLKSFIGFTDENPRQFDFHHAQNHEIAKQIFSVVIHIGFQFVPWIPFWIKAVIYAQYVFVCLYTVHRTPIDMCCEQIIIYVFEWEKRFWPISLSVSECWNVNLIPFSLFCYRNIIRYVIRQYFFVLT